MGLRYQACSPPTASSQVLLHSRTVNEHESISPSLRIMDHSIEVNSRERLSHEHGSRGSNLTNDIGLDEQLALSIRTCYWRGSTLMGMIRLPNEVYLAPSRHLQGNEVAMTFRGGRKPVLVPWLVVTVGYMGPLHRTIDLRDCVSVLRKKKTMLGNSAPLPSHNRPRIKIVRSPIVGVFRNTKQRPAQRVKG